MNSRNHSIVRRIVSAASAVALTAGLFGGIASATAAESPEVRVSYSDLDLNRSADVQVLYRRLERAAGAACGDVPSVELDRYRAWQVCQRAVLDAAVRQVHSTALLAFAQAHAPGRS